MQSTPSAVMKVENFCHFGSKVRFAKLRADGFEGQKISSILGLKNY
jgi:hypothetical protein